MSALEQPFIAAIESNKIEDGSTKPLEPSNLIYLASATKLLTTIAALHCCERGLLSLDEDQVKNIPNIADKGVLLPYNAGSDEPMYEPLKKPITLRQLLSHSSGLVYPFTDPKLGKWREANPAPPLPRTSLQQVEQPLSFQPGEGWMYGVGIDVAGYLVEQASGMKLDAYFREHLLEPAGIDPTDLSFFPVEEGMADRMPDVNPKDPKGEGKMASGGQSVHDEGETECFGGHGAYATIHAYAAVMQSITNNDEKVLKRSSVAEMFKPQLEAGARKAFDDALQGPFAAFFNQGATGDGRDYGLSGTYIGEDGDGGMGKGSLAWGGGLNTVWFMDASNGLCGVASIQLGLPPGGQIAMELKDAFRRGLKAQMEASA